MNIIAGIDGHDQRHEALALGADLARLGGGKLVLVYVFPWSPAAARLGPAYAVTVREDAEELLREAAGELGDVPCETRAVGDMSAPRALHRIAREEDADMIVIGSSHHGPVGRTLVGGMGERVIHAAPCPVAIAPHGYAPASGEPRRLGVAYDASPQSKGALAWTGGFAASIGAAVTVLEVHEPLSAAVVGPPGFAYPIDDLTKDTRKQCQDDVDEAVAALPPEVRPFGRVLEGPVARSLADAADDLDLLVTGSRGYGPHGAVLLGSVTHELAHISPCPVIVLPRSASEAEDESVVRADDRTTSPA